MEKRKRIENRTICTSKELPSRCPCENYKISSNSGEKRREFYDPKEFAELYINKKVVIPSLTSHWFLSEPEINKGVSILKKKCPILSLDNLNLSAETIKSIYIALWEFSSVLIFDNMKIFKEENKKESEGRNKAAKKLKNALELFSSSSTSMKLMKQDIRQLIEKFKKVNGQFQNYSPLHEPLFASIGFLVLYHSGDIPGIIKGLKPVDLPQPNVLPESIVELGKIGLELIGMPLKSTGTKPSAFFSKAMRIVIYKYIRKEVRYTEKAKKFTAAIINDFITAKYKECPSDIRPPVKQFTPKDIDNALHS